MECHKNAVILNLQLPDHFHPSQRTGGQEDGDENGSGGGAGGGEKREESREDDLQESKENPCDLDSTLVHYKEHSCKLFHLSFPVIL